MSLLINESYANPTTPLWVPASGSSTITGNLTVDGQLTVDGNIVKVKFDTSPAISVPNATDSQNVGQLDLQTESTVAGGFAAHLRMGIDGATGTYGTGFIQSVVPTQGYGPLALQPDGGRVGINTITPNATLEVNGNILASGSGNVNAVNFIASGNVICPPIQVLTAPQSTNVLASITNYLPDNPINVLNGEEYDICCKVELAPTGAPPVAGDTITFWLSCDATPTWGDKSSWTWTIPAPTGNVKFQLRDRMIANSSTTMTFGVDKQVTNPATMTFVATCEQWDVTRVA